MSRLATGRHGLPTAAEPAALVRTRSWLSRYLGLAAAVDAGCALLAGIIAFEARYHARVEPPGEYLVFTAVLPFLWWPSIALAGGYDARIVGAGVDEYRRILRAGLGLTACVAVSSYAAKLDLARGYVVVALPCATGFDLLARYALRQRLYRLRRVGCCIQRAVAVGPARGIVELATMLRRDTSHGLSVVAACLAGDEHQRHTEVAGIPVAGGVASVTAAVVRFGADTVAVVNCAEMDGFRLRELAWALEKTGTDLCVAPALLDIAGPRTTIRPIAGLPLVHLDHVKLTGPKRIVKAAFDKVVAASVLAFLSPLLILLASAIIGCDGGPVLFQQIRVGKGGRPFTVYKFRSMKTGAEARKADLEVLNEVNGVLFKIRKDPRLTPLGGWMRRCSIDEIPQLLNVLRGEMSLVGPRPWAALPYQKASGSGDSVPRRLAVKPGMTGLWQVSGRANLPWEESVRLDLWYVEHWSLALDLQILWKTGHAVLAGTGAY
jgi:exopolysaccharide biosynthesis polyprenyl glycosylphosphotransferase